jgi:LAO/AO transport system kinase
LNKESLENFIVKVLAGDKRSVSRAISLIESDIQNGELLLSGLYQHIGKAYRVGITGPPGAGKSSITNQLAKMFSKAGKKVGIIAVDPTSPFTGGALLGDRVRMSDIGNTEGIFIRSMATRGSLGGLNARARDAADVLDAAGYDYILFETVGVGQSELDIVKAADSVIVVLVPESGDAIQAMKAGLMEIANFYIVNKADRPGAEQAVTAIKAMLMMRDHNAQSWMPNVLKTVATENKGIAEVVIELERHQAWLNSEAQFGKHRLQRVEERIREIVRDKLLHELWNSDRITAFMEERLKTDAALKISPYENAGLIIDEFKNSIQQ